VNSLKVAPLPPVTPQNAGIVVGQLECGFREIHGVAWQRREPLDNSLAFGGQLRERKDDGSIEYVVKAHDSGTTNRLSGDYNRS
jgi:hypothetical protein